MIQCEMFCVASCVQNERIMMRRDALLSFCLLFINTSRNDMEDCDNDNKLLLGDFITSFLVSSFVLHRL